MNEPDRNLALIARVHAGDKAAFSTLLSENEGLIWSIARRFFGRGVEPDDLYQLGCVGFVKAVRGFDPAFGTRFSTYAVPKITGEIRRFLRDDGPVKVGRTTKELQAKICAAPSSRCGRRSCKALICELFEHYFGIIPNCLQFLHHFRRNSSLFPSRHLDFLRKP